MSDTEPETSILGGNDKLMKLRYAGTCRICGRDLPAKGEAVYERDTKSVRCVSCPSPEGPSDSGRESLGSGAHDSVEPDVAEDFRVERVGAKEIVETAAQDESQLAKAGASARREYERRRAKDEQRIREKWGRLGGIAVALSDERQSTKAWAVGAVGEERLGTMLDGMQSESLAVLHDRRIPRTRANIDHLAVTPSAVWVIDAKRYKGRPELRVEGGILRPRVEKLVVGGRDCTKVVDGVLKQMALVQDVVGETVPVLGALCFTDSEWPMIGGAFTTRGVHVLWPRRLRKLMFAEGTAGLDVAALHRALAGHFPVA